MKVELLKLQDTSSDAILHVAIDPNCNVPDLQWLLGPMEETDTTIDLDPSIPLEGADVESARLAVMDYGWAVLGAGYVPQVCILSSIESSKIGFFLHKVATVADGGVVLGTAH